MRNIPYGEMTENGELFSKWNSDYSKKQVDVEFKKTKCRAF